MLIFPHTDISKVWTDRTYKAFLSVNFNSVNKNDRVLPIITTEFPYELMSICPLVLRVRKNILNGRRLLLICHFFCCYSVNNYWLSVQSSLLVRRFFLAFAVCKTCLRIWLLEYAKFCNYDCHDGQLSDNFVFCPTISYMQDMHAYSVKLGKCNYLSGNRTWQV